MAIVAVVVVAGAVGSTVALTSGSSSSKSRSAASSSSASRGGQSPANPLAGTSNGSTTGGVPVGVTPHVQMYAFYYLWWDFQHWHARLGSDYPYNQAPLPLPASLDSSGCGTTSRYPGNQLTDVPSQLFSQDDPAQIANDVRQAAATGLTGFAVSWAGTGLPGQTVKSSDFNRRLAMLVDAVHQINARGVNFKLWVAYISSAVIRTSDAMDNDFAYLKQTYGGDPAFDLSNSGRPTLIMMGSRKYPQSVLDQVSANWRSTYYLVADENWSTWNSAKAADFDADQYYWSSQNPATDPGSFGMVGKLAKSVRSARNPDGSAKKFFSPLAPGYNKQLSGGSSCVPRRNGDTLRSIYTGNQAAAKPDGWMVISWNEISEGTYILPLQRYGTQNLDALKAIITR